MKTSIELPDELMNRLIAYNKANPGKKINKSWECRDRIEYVLNKRKAP